MSFCNWAFAGRNLRKHLAAVCVAILSSLATSASAAPVIFNSATAFDAAISGFSLEGFETPVTAGATVNLGGYSISETSATPWMNQNFAATMATDGLCSLEYRSDGPSTIRFTFAAPQTAFGVSIISFGNTGAGSLTVSDNSGATSPLVLGSSLPQLDPLNTIFYGISSPDAPFTEVVFVTTTTNDLIALDGVRNLAAPANVPEPSTLLLGAGAVACWAAGSLRRWRR